MVDRRNAYKHLSFRSMSYKRNGIRMQNPNNGRSSIISRQDGGQRGEDDETEGEKKSTRTNYRIFVKTATKPEGKARERREMIGLECKREF